MNRMSSRRHCKPYARGDVYTGRVDATPALVEVGRQLDAAKLDAVLIGNAAAALQGAPVTTVDFDFLFRKTTRNLVKLKVVARGLRAVVLRPYYPASDLYRMSRDEDGLQVDFMGTIHGVRSFEGVRDRAAVITVGGVSCASRRSRTSSAARKLRVGRATWQSSTFWKKRLKHSRNRRTKLRAVARESERALGDMIRRWQRLPPERRTNFLRKRIAPGRSTL